MKSTFSIITAIILFGSLTSCKKITSVYWKVENQSSSNIQLNGVTPDSITINNSISPGTTITLYIDHRYPGSAGDMEISQQQKIDIDSLIIINSVSEIMQRSPQNLENWESEAIEPNEVEFVLIVEDSDF